MIYNRIFPKNKAIMALRIKPHLFLVRLRLHSNRIPQLRWQHIAHFIWGRTIEPVNTFITCCSECIDHYWYLLPLMQSSRVNYYRISNYELSFTQIRRDIREHWKNSNLGSEILAILLPQIIMHGISDNNHEIAFTNSELFFFFV